LAFLPVETGPVAPVALSTATVPGATATPATVAAPAKPRVKVGETIAYEDLLDYVGDEAETGKPVGGDLREHKVTLPLIAALPQFTVAERAEVEALMADPAPSDDRIAGVVRAVSRHGGLEYARARAQRHAESADRALDNLPASAARDALRASIPYVLERRS
jgi:octaprenyl-diphosphate synthase